MNNFRGNLLEQTPWGRVILERLEEVFRFMEHGNSLPWIRGGHCSGYHRLGRDIVQSDVNLPMLWRNVLPLCVGCLMM